MENNENKNVNTEPQVEETTAKAEPKAEEKEEKSRFDVEPIEFLTTIESMYMNGSQIRNVVDDMFRAVLADYSGCILRINNGVSNVINKFVAPGQPYLDLLFRESTAPGLHVLHAKESKKGLDMMTRLNSVFGSNAGRRYILDTDVLEAMEEFFPVNQDAKNNANIIGWNNPERISEYPITGAPIGPAGFNPGGYIEVAIMGVPLDLVLKKVYGCEKYTSYMVTPFRSTMNNQDLVFNISKMDADGADNFAKALGWGAATPVPRQMWGMNYNGFNGFANGATR